MHNSFANLVSLSYSGLFFAAVVFVSFSASQGVAQSSDTAASGPRDYEVDRLGQGPYKTLASVAKLAQPGDTIRIKPGTGLYREMLMVRNSGTEAQPIVIDGGGNVITGFDEVKKSDWEERNGLSSFRLKVFPCVIAYKGERLVQDARDTTTKLFTKYATLNDAKDRVTLLPNVSKDGWEVSARMSVVQINDVSHHIYRNIKASGGGNDGFNLHGVGTGLVFENIEGYHNLDEGYSSHDGIISTIRHGKFWGNDNGIANSYTPKGGNSFSALSTIVEDTDVYDNLGFGINLHDCSASLKNVRIWHNGMRQLIFNKVQATCENVTVYTPKYAARQWLSYKDSMNTVKMVAYSAGETELKGPPPTVLEEDAP